MKILFPVNQSQFLALLEDVLETHDHVTKETAKGYQKVEVLGWSITIEPDQEYIWATFRPLHVNDKERGTRNLIKVLLDIFLG